MKADRSHEIISLAGYFKKSQKLEILTGENHDISRARIAVIKFSRCILATGFLEILATGFLEIKRY